MPRIVSLSGVEDAAELAGAAGADAKQLSDGIKITGAYRVVKSRGASDVVVDVKLDDNHVIEVELENGVTLWRTADGLAEDGRVDSRSGAGDKVLLPTSLPYGPPGRSIVDVAVRLYRFFTLDDAARFTAQKIAEEFEEVVGNTDRLLRCVRPDKLQPVKGTSEIPTNRDILVLIHGTFSSTSGSFGSLVQSAMGSGEGELTGRWGRLEREFRDPEGGPAHIYAFEHRSLTASPVENAIELLKALPKGARIHLLSHSRGGMVGELITRAARLDAGEDPIDDKDLQIVRGVRESAGEDSVEKELGAYRELGSLLRTRAPVIRSFVRVAAPVQGTVLASRRLDRYLSVFANALRLIPGPQNMLFGPMRNFVRGIVGARRDATLLPGLEAMMPSSPLVAILNRPDIQIDSPLTVIGGDVEADGILRALAVLASDLFFREDHDIVVNTAAMLGGLVRRDRKTARMFLDRGGEVNHFNYFTNPATADRVIAGLTGGLTPDDTFPLYPDAAPAELAAPALGRGGGLQGTRPVAILLPGIMGSNLAMRGDRIWVDPIKLVLGGIGKLGASGNPPKMARGVEPDGMIRKYYARLAQELSRSHEVEVFDYDWRKSIMDEGNRLAGRIRHALDLSENSARKQPIRIVAHSMGGLVTRAFIAQNRELWDKMTAEREGSRVLMLGTPNAGSMSMAAGLVGRDRMIRLLERVDVTNNMREIINAIKPLPGVLELLATDDDFRAYDKALWESWAPIAPRGWTPPAQTWLDAARKVHQTLQDDLKAHADDVDHMAYIAGKADTTIVGLESVGTASRPKARLLATTAGDGRVTWRSGRIPGLATWYAPATEHGDLARDPSLFPAILDIVHTGTTQQLSQQMPASRGEERVFEMPEEMVLHPGPENLELIGMGGTPQILIDRRLQAAERTRVRVVHGDLRYQPGTVTVGHYRNAPLIHAERALDRSLGGKLSERRRLGLYPGELMTSDVFFGAKNPVGPSAALVVGLGQFGELSRESLIATMAQAFLQFSLRWHERRNGQPEEPCTLTTLLIGQRDSILSVSDSVRAVLEALQNANRRLMEDGKQIAELTFLELFEDTAVEAAQALRDLQRETPIAAAYLLDDQVRAGQGGRRRTGTRDEADWEQKLRISLHHERAEDGDVARGFSFESLNRTALVPKDRSTVNWRRLDRLIETGTDDTATDRTTGPLIFEWLVPPRMKTLFSDGRNLTILVDEQAARVPWELMVDRWRDTKVPIAVRANLMRQLVREISPERPVVASTERVLIIGDPKSDFRPLDAARAEARAVGEMFREHGWAEDDVIVQEGEQARVLEQISLEENQIFHFAGHGVSNWGKDKLTGLVIDNTDVLEPAFVRTLRRMPEFVFLNCCHAGGVRAEEDGAASPEDPAAAWRGRSELAANLAVEFMRHGASAVIAAGWEVDDQAAEIFARSFYSGFLEGMTFGDAVREARTATWEHNKSIDTWGAYQCYGDPQFRLRRGVAGERPTAPRRRFVSVSQIIVALETLKLEAQATRSTPNVPGLKRELEEYEDEIRDRPDWQASAPLLEAFGAAAAELGFFDRAIRYFEQATHAAPPDYTARMLEQLFELKVREATRTRSIKQIKAAIQQLESLSKLGGSGEPAARHSKIGDAYMRLAACHAQEADAGSQTLHALEKAQAAYETAIRDHDRQQKYDSRHAHLRRAVASFFAGLHDDAGSRPANFVNDVLNLVSALESEIDHVRGFRHYRLLAEAKLFRLVVEKLNADAAGNIIEDEETEELRIETATLFNNAFNTGSSIRSRKETVDDLRVTVHLLRNKRPEGEQEVAKLVRELELAPGAGRI